MVCHSSSDKPDHEKVKGGGGGSEEGEGRGEPESFIVGSGYG